MNAPTCERLLWRRGENVRCGNSVGVHTWNDFSGALHHGCAQHIEGLRHRYPEYLPDRLPTAGKLGLSTPWARGAFGPADRITVENEIPTGWTVGVSVSARRTWVILWLVDPDGEERARSMDKPLRQAVAGAMSMAKLAQTLVGVPA